ncbi:MAG: TetR/AcrR family transcriptional regulator [Lachnospiraceae bacterium]
MPSDAAKTHEDILSSAKAEFLEYGFAGASLRRIAANAGVTTGALYRHFRDKDALFNALVAPVYNQFLEQYEATGELHLKQLEAEGMDPMWEASASSIEGFIEYIYSHFDTFKLLINCSEQSPYEHFTHTLVELDVRLTSKYLELAKTYGHPVRDVSRRELHFVITAQFSCVLELVIHEVPYEEAKQMLKNITRFITAGWNALLME